MKIKKSIVLKILDSLGEDFKAEELIKRILDETGPSNYDPAFVEKIKQGEADIAAGRTRVVDIDNLWEES